MMDIEKITQVAMEIITYAGLAKSNYLLALKDYKSGFEDEAIKKMQIGELEFNKAHETHMEVLTMEMQQLEPQVSLLMVHAEDQLMGAEHTKILVEELIEVYKDRRR